MRSRFGAGRVTGLLLIFALAWLTTAPALAGPGVKLSHGEVQVTDTLFTGSQYALPSMVVSNPGDEVSGYAMGIADVDDETSSIPESWLEFQPARFELRPGESQRVDMTLTIPANAVPGPRGGLVAVRIEPVGDAYSTTGARVGAGAGARLEFDLAAPTLIQGIVARAAAAWEAGGVWSHVLLGVTVLSILVRGLTRRFTIRVQRR